MSDSASPPIPAKVMLGCLAAALLAVYVISLAGPGDMHRLDQPRTASYTVDMVQNGRWFLPMDIEGRTATKPPLINWLTAPLIAAGWHDPFAFWLPVMAAHLLTVVLLVWWTATLWRGESCRSSLSARPPGLPGQASPAMSWTLGGLAGLLYLSSPYTANLPTYVRPDSLCMPLLTAAWWSATQLLRRIAETRPSEHPTAAPALRSRTLPLALLFWLLVGLLALTKGVPALYPLVYLLVAAKWLHGRVGLVLRTGWWWGLPLATGLFLLWVIPAYRADPAYFLQGLVGAQTLGRFTGVRGILGAEPEMARGPLDLLTTAWKIPRWFIDHLAPMSVLAVFGFFTARAWRGGHVLRPALLWLVVTLALPLLSAGKTAQYILPCAVPAAILAAAAIRPWVEGSRAVAFAVVALFVIAASGFTFQYQFWGAKTRHTTARGLQAFAREASRRVGDEPVVFVATGFNSLKPLMGRSQPGEPSGDARARASWIVAPRRLTAGLHAELSSGPVYIDPTGDAIEGLDTLWLLRADTVAPGHPLRAVAHAPTPAGKRK